MNQVDRLLWSPRCTFLIASFRLCRRPGRARLGVWCWTTSSINSSKRIEGTADKPTAVAALFNRDTKVLPTQSIKLSSLGLWAGVGTRRVDAKDDLGAVSGDGVWAVAGLGEHDSAFFVFTARP